MYFAEVQNSFLLNKHLDSAIPFVVTQLVFENWGFTVFLGQSHFFLLSLYNMHSKFYNTSCKSGKLFFLTIKDYDMPIFPKSAIIHISCLFIKNGPNFIHRGQGVIIKPCGLFFGYLKPPPLFVDHFTIQILLPL